MAKTRKNTSNRGNDNGNGNGNGINGKNGNKVGRLSRNPYFNFAKKLRSENNYSSMKESLKDAALKWKELSLEEKQTFCQEARNCDTLTMIAPFYILGEKDLGRTYRKDLAKFKKLLDKTISDRVQEIKDLKSKSK